MSDTEEDFRFFGTPLEPYDEDSFPSKKPISIEEQSARDAQGRRRFHGAFTGGFSAGFFNTVGSLEGWRPQEFKSSRSEKAHNVRQKPEDFMDDEDMGEFGIAPQVVQATSDYSSANSKKRKRPMALNEGPIPGEPVLESLLQAGNETVGYFLMKNISRKHKSRETDSGAKVYGCHMPKDLPNEMNEIMVDDIQYELHEIYKTFLANPKTNTFGLGYVGLSRIFGNESRPAHLSGTERNNKKFSISGQAFGVGAFEDEDDDIYVKDDMSRYDFEMSAENVTPKLKDSHSAGKTILDIFVLGTKTTIDKNVFPPPTIPNSFTGKYKTKRSRFAPREEDAVPERKAMDATVRASFLGENVEKTHTPSNQQHKKPKETLAITNEPEIKKEVVPIFPGLMLDRFVSAQLNEDTHNILEVVKSSESEHGTKEMRDAVKLKMFGPLTHSIFDWQPCSFLCRKFDVPEPNVESSMVKTKKRTKNLIFEYQKHAEVSVDLKPGLSVSKDPEPVVVPKEEPQDVPSNEDVPAEVPHAAEQPQNVEEVKKIDVIDLTERVDVAKNFDLFKSVFLSSDEEEDEDEEKVEEQKTEEIVESVVLEPLIPIIKTKEGILSNLDFTKFNSAPIITEKVKVIDETAPDTYGPKLPAKLQSINSTIVEQPVINEDEWVEKGNEKKHKKKHKKEKRKKHKHKSKR